MFSDQKKGRSHIYEAEGALFYIYALTKAVIKCGRAGVVIGHD